MTYNYIMNKLKRTTIRIEKSALEQTKDYSARQGISMQDVINMSLYSFLNLKKENMFTLRDLPKYNLKLGNEKIDRDYIYDKFQ